MKWSWSDGTIPAIEASLRNAPIPSKVQPGSCLLFNVHEPYLTCIAPVGIPVLLGAIDPEFNYLSYWFWIWFLATWWIVQGQTGIRKLDKHGDFFRKPECLTSPQLPHLYDCCESCYSWINSTGIPSGSRMYINHMRPLYSSFSI